MRLLHLIGLLFTLPLFLACLVLEEESGARFYRKAIAADLDAILAARLPDETF